MKRDALSLAPRGEIEVETRGYSLSIPYPGVLDATRLLGATWRAGLRQLRFLSFSGVLLSAVLFLAPEASSAPPDDDSSASPAVKWIWEPDAACVISSSLKTQVEQVMETRVFFEPSSDSGPSSDSTLILQSFLSQGKAGPEAYLTLRRGDGEELGERQLSAADCEELETLLVVVVPMMLRPFLDSSAGPKEPVPSPEPVVREEEPAPPAEVALLAEAPVEPKPRPTDAMVVSCGGSAGALLGFGPASIAPRVAVGCFIPVHSILAIDLSAEYRFRVPVDEFSLSAGGGRIALCGGRRPENYLGVCGGAGVLSQSARAKYPIEVRRDERAVPELSVWLKGRKRIAGVLLQLDAGGNLPWVRPQYTVRSATSASTVIYQNWPVLLFVDIGLSFPLQ